MNSIEAMLFIIIFFGVTLIIYFFVSILFNKKIKKCEKQTKITEYKGDEQ